MLWALDAALDFASFFFLAFTICVCCLLFCVPPWLEKRFPFFLYLDGKYNLLVRKVTRTPNSRTTRTEMHFHAHAPLLL